MTENFKEITTIRVLFCRLSDEELMRSGQELADEEVAIEKIEAEKAKKVADYNSAIKTRKESVSRLSHLIEKGEERTVPVVMRFNPDHGEVVIYRTDNGTEEDWTEVERRTMTAEELQEEMDFEATESADPPEDEGTLALGACGVCGNYIHNEDGLGWVHDDKSPACEGAPEEPPAPEAKA